MAEFVPGSASLPSSEVELTISCRYHKYPKSLLLHSHSFHLLYCYLWICRNLLDCDVFSKSDPMCVLKMKTAEFPQWREIFRTEKISNTLNPDFTKKVCAFIMFFNTLRPSSVGKVVYFINLLIHINGTFWIYRCKSSTVLRSSRFYDLKFMTLIQKIQVCRNKTFLVTVQQPLVR